MKRVGLISDTHSHWDERLSTLFADVDELWHAGDIGDIRLLEKLQTFKPLRAVYGNIDDRTIRCEVPEMLRFECEGVDVLMTHIGGYPGKYSPKVREILSTNPPKIIIAGHSHILKVMYDNKYDVLHLNPGACGISGFHAVRTALRFIVDDSNIRDMEIIEIGARRTK
jgi:putative phosphoesterase